MIIKNLPNTVVDVSEDINGNIILHLYNNNSSLWIKIRPDQKLKIWEVVISPINKDPYTSACNTYWVDNIYNYLGNLLPKLLDYSTNN